MTRTYGWQALLICIAAIMILVAGCGKPPKQEPEPEPQLPIEQPIEIVQEPEPEPEPEPEIIYPYTYPLTGIGTEEELVDRPFLVLVENHRAARPQSGLIDADIVYEILVEGEITRFAAIFHSQQPEVIGPVRSLRPYFAQLAEGWDAPIVHAGYSPAAIEYVRQKKLDHFDEIYNAGAYFWRSKERSAPHNLYTSIELLRKGQTNRKVRTEWKQPEPISFAEKEAVITGDVAEKVTVTYLRGYKVEYEYQAETGTYLRHMAGEPHLDKETEQQIETANLLIIKTSHRVLDNVGRREINVDGPGKGWLVQQGKVREIDWERKGGIIRPYIDGQEVPLLPGKTWIQVISPDLSATFTAAEEQ